MTLTNNNCMEGNVKRGYTRGMIANIRFSISFYDSWPENERFRHTRTKVSSSFVRLWNLVSHIKRINIVRGCSRIACCGR